MHRSLLTLIPAPRFVAPVMHGTRRHRTACSADSSSVNSVDVVHLRPGRSAGTGSVQGAFPWSASLPDKIVARRTHGEQNGRSS